MRLEGMKEGVEDDEEVKEGMGPEDEEKDE
jgi:hypothetical protein